MSRPTTARSRTASRAGVNSQSETAAVEDEQTKTQTAAAELCDWSPMSSTRTVQHHHQLFPARKQKHVIDKNLATLGRDSLKTTIVTDSDECLEFDLTSPRAGMRGRDPFRSAGRVNNAIGRMFITRSVSNELEANIRRANGFLKTLSTPVMTLQQRHPNANHLIVGPSRLVVLDLNKRSATVPKTPPASRGTVRNGRQQQYEASETKSEQTTQRFDY